MLISLFKKVIEPIERSLVISGQHDIHKAHKPDVERRVIRAASGAKCRRWYIEQPERKFGRVD